jgi:hypothetical protein
MALEFEWDDEKAESNLAKHGVSFDEASTVFLDRLSVTILDPLHSEEENRFVLLGESCLGRILVVVHMERGDNIRIISVREATHREKRIYAEGED